VVSDILVEVLGRKRVGTRIVDKIGEMVIETAIHQIRSTGDAHLVSRLVGLKLVEIVSKIESSLLRPYLRDLVKLSGAIQPAAGKLLPVESVLLAKVLSALLDTKDTDFDWLSSQNMLRIQELGEAMVERGNQTQIEQGVILLSRVVTVSQDI
jgi:hypothetical protein